MPTDWMLGFEIMTYVQEKSTEQQEFPMTDKETRKSPRIMIAGAGIGGLVLAVGLLKKGLDVQIFERDLTAIRGEGKYRGPIQVISLALDSWFPVFNVHKWNL